MSSQTRHTRFYMEYAVGNPQDWDWFDQEWGQIQRAWEWIKNHDAPGSLLFLRIFVSFLDRRSLWAEEITWTQIGIQIAQRLGDRQQECVLLNSLGVTLANIGQVYQSLDVLRSLPDFSRRTRFYPAERFQYDIEHDQYIRPQGRIFRLYSRRKSEQVYVYAADPAVCDACPVKAECTDSKSGRHIFLSFFQEDLDRVKAYQETESYQKAMRKRSLWTEPLFGETKQFHQMRKFRLRGLMKVNIEGVMVAAGQNIKRLIKQGSTELFPFFKIGSVSRPFPYPSDFFNRLDLFVLAKDCDDNLIAITVEGKVSESFDKNLSERNVEGSPGKYQRLALSKKR